MGCTSSRQEVILERNIGSVVDLNRQVSMSSNSVQEVQTISTAPVYRQISSNEIGTAGSGNSRKSGSGSKEMKSGSSVEMSSASSRDGSDSSSPSKTVIKSPDNRKSRGLKSKRQSSEFKSSEEEFYGLDIDFNLIERGDSIGSGTYGQVFKCRYKGKMYALKKIFIPESPEDRQEMYQDFAKEISILSVLRHERIVRFVGAVRTNPNFALMFELCEGCVGTLLRMVRRRKVQVTWNICLTIAKDCAEAVDYLHSMRPQIIHRDLKAENLLLTGQFRCKLTDFGLSRVYEGRKSAMTVCGTPCWVAPEIFRGEAYNEKIDVYSYGVLLWELFTGKKPYVEFDAVELPYRVGKKGLRPPLLRHCPPSLNELMRDCWRENASMRPTFKEIQTRLLEVEQDLEAAKCLNNAAHQTSQTWALAKPPAQYSALSRSIDDAQVTSQHQIPNSA